MLIFYLLSSCLPYYVRIGAEQGAKLRLFRNPLFCFFRLGPTKDTRRCQRPVSKDLLLDPYSPSDLCDTGQTSDAGYRQSIVQRYVQLLVQPSDPKDIFNTDVILTGCVQTNRRLKDTNDFLTSSSAPSHQKESFTQQSIPAAARNSSVLQSSFMSANYVQES